MDEEQHTNWNDGQTPGADVEPGESADAYAGQDADGAGGDAVASSGGEEAGDPDDVGSPVPPHETRHSRRRFLVIVGAVIALLMGALEVLRRMAGPGGGVTGGAAQSVKNLFSSFPVNAVEAIPNKTWSDWSPTVDGLVDKPLTRRRATCRGRPARVDRCRFSRPRCNYFGHFLGLAEERLGYSRLVDALHVRSRFGAIVVTPPSAVRAP